VVAVTDGYPPPGQRGRRRTLKAEYGQDLSSTTDKQRAPPCHPLDRCSRPPRAGAGYSGTQAGGCPLRLPGLPDLEVVPRSRSQDGRSHAPASHGTEVARGVASSYLPHSEQAPNHPNHHGPLAGGGKPSLTALRRWDVVTARAAIHPRARTTWSGC
jgi:hypothetical protein